MELVSILRVLWRRRILVGVGVLVATAVGLLAAGGSLPLPGSSSGSEPAARSALLRVFVDTTSSQVVNPDPRAADTVAARAVLLAGLVASDTARADIAGRMGVPPDRLAVVGPSVSVPTIPTKLSEGTAVAVEAAPEPFAVTLRADGEMPIVSIDTRAPDAARARRLANAAAATLASLTAPRDDTVKKGFVAEALGQPVVAPAKPGRGPAAVALAAFLAAFAIWCGCLVLASGLTPAPRRSGARVA